MNKTYKRKIEKNYTIIDTYFAQKYKKAKTLERIKIRGVQRAIEELIELNILLELECGK